MAVGEAGLILTSTDGSKWVRRNSGVNQWLNDSAYVAGRWFVASNSGWILTSTDGINWSVSSSGTSRSLNSLAFSGNQIIAAGADGVILRKNLVQPATPVNFLSFSQDFSLGSFLFDGFPDQQFWLEEATSINGPWKPITALELLDSSGTLLLQRDTPPSPERFYRTRLRE